MKIRRRIWILAAIPMLLSACGKKTAGPMFAQTQVPADLVICTDQEPLVYEPVVKEFEERTGLSVEVQAGTSENVRQMFEQAKDWDLAFGVSTELLDEYAALWMPYESAQEAAVAETFRSVDHSWSAFSVLPLVIMYNTNVVTYRELPVGWASLLEPRWKGRVAFADPEKSDISLTALAAAALVSPEKEQYVQELAGKLDHNLLENIAQVKEEILDGRCSVGVTTEETAQALRSSGADVDYIYPEEGTLLVLEGTAIRRGTVHEETAKQFLEFTLSKDVQKILMDSQSRRSVRQDVETPKGMDALERLPLPDADFETISMEKRKILESWKSISDAEAGMGGAS